MSFLSILWIALKILILVYLIISIVATITTFSVINRTAVLLADKRPEIYEACGLKEFCEKPILLQIFPKCVLMGFIPVLNVANIIAFIKDREWLVVDLANEFIEDFLAKVVVSMEEEAENQEAL